MGRGDVGAHTTPSPEDFSDDGYVETASRFAGKLAFLTQATFGAVGKAALQHFTHKAMVKASLRVIKAMLNDIKPRFIPAGGYLRGRLRQGRWAGP